MKLSRTLFIIGAAILFAATAQAQVGRNSSGLLDVNIATEAELTAVGITAEAAKLIIARRPFATITAFHQFLLAQGPAEQTGWLYSKMFIHVNLDAGTREEILLIPGAGPRMAREFLEYRPYTGGLPQFRREIGKYVDSAEVARLEQYVFVPIKLNTASDEDILSIPGLGRRMLREFKEYRPYDSIEKFRKEISKYVDAKELARLERFVVVK